MTYSHSKLIRYLTVATIAVIALALYLVVNTGVTNSQSLSPDTADAIAARDAVTQKNELVLTPESCSTSTTLAAATLTHRLTRNGVVSTCMSATHPGVYPTAGAYAYSVLTLPNTSSSPTCMTFTITTTGASDNLQMAAFRAPFVPGDLGLASRYLGDSGVSTDGAKAVSFQAVVPANTSVALVVMSPVSGAGAGTPFSVHVTSPTASGLCGNGVGIFNYTGAPVAIPDANPAGVNLSIPVAGVGRVRDLVFNFTTSGTCDATVGNTFASVSHTYVGDLIFKLTSPQGTTVTFMNRRGGARGNICSSTIQDEFNYPPLSSITSVPGQPIVGYFETEPTGRFTNFRGENADGMWRLNVSDNAGADIGMVRRFALSFRDYLYPNEDFDNDGATDIAISRSNGPNREWWYLRSTQGTNRAFVFGTPTDRMAPGDYTGDGAIDIAFWRPSTGTWYILRSEDSTFYAFPFGNSTDIPAPADFDGDGKTDAAVFRPVGATWYISKSTGGTAIQAFGSNGDAPVPADYDGDNHADIAVFRANGAIREWWVYQSKTATHFATVFGATGDRAVPADYTGDGRADIAVWRPSSGNWYILRSEDYSYFAFPFGSNGDEPAPGDYDSDGRADAAVFRPSNSTWYVNRSTAGVMIQQFGAPGDVPVQSAHVW